ncbi:MULTISPECIES: hypothetical protein [unclassified Kitasatospora]|uniref:hypothetical protein n=1 Tax=unclassified Kitasatospora TaxID=2633591 RepID=UPI0034070E3A
MDDFDPFTLDGFAPATPEAAHAVYMLDFLLDTPPLRLQHTPATGSPRHSYYLFQDEVCIGPDLPAPQFVAAYVQRDPTTATYTTDYEILPMIALAERWLIERGADPDAVTYTGGLYARPDDPATRQVEDRLRTPGRYEVLAHFTYGWERSPSWVLALDQHAPDPDLAYRVFHQHVDEAITLDIEAFWARGSDATDIAPGPGWYSLTEHAFATLQEVQEWTRTIDAAWVGGDPGYGYEESFTFRPIPTHAIFVPSAGSRAQAAATRTRAGATADRTAPERTSAPAPPGPHRDTAPRR